MAKKTRISALEYKPLRDAFYNASYLSSGTLARLLLEAFIFEDGDINAEWFLREKVCVKGSFTKLRDRLVKDGWLHFRDDTKRYFPGIRLRPHLETVKSAKAVTFAHLELKADRTELELKADRSELALKADRSELEETRARLEETNRAMTKIADAVRDLQEAMLPPDTDEKKRRREKATREIARQSRAN
jgi:hypothetical protein